jgi:hypothetical protein
MLLMKRRTRIQYTEADKALMWERPDTQVSPAGL